MEKQSTEMRPETVSTRTLKIECAGDFWRGGIHPKIRLVGKWLERSGFRPGHRVAVHQAKPGELVLRFLEQTSDPAL